MRASAVLLRNRPALENRQWSPLENWAFFQPPHSALRNDDKKAIIPFPVRTLVSTPVSRPRSEGGPLVKARIHAFYIKK